MKLSTVLATTAAVISLAGVAVAADTKVKAETTIDHSKNGGYEKTTTAEKKTPSGMVSDEAKTDLDVDNDGDSEKTTTTKHTTDPKGLMNKHTEKTEVKEKMKDGKTTVEKTHKIDGKTVSESETK